MKPFHSAMDDDLAGWWFLIVLLNACAIRRRRVHLTGIRRYRSNFFFYVIRFFLNEEKFSDFDDFSKTS